MVPLKEHRGTGSGFKQQDAEVGFGLMRKAPTAVRTALQVEKPSLFKNCLLPESGSNYH